MHLNGQVKHIERNLAMLGNSSFVLSYPQKAPKKKKKEKYPKLTWWHSTASSQTQTWYSSETANTALRNDEFFLDLLLTSLFTVRTGLFLLISVFLSSLVFNALWKRASAKQEGLFMC